MTPPGSDKASSLLVLYLDITHNQMFSLDGYPIEGKRGLQLCREHGNQLEQKEVVLFDGCATEASLPDHCGVCEE